MKKMKDPPPPEGLPIPGIARPRADVRAMPSETGNPDLGWWDADNSSDPSGHFSRQEYSEKRCDVCGAPVDFDFSEDINHLLTYSYRCPDCGCHRRATECGFSSEGAIPDDPIDFVTLLPVGDGSSEIDP